MTLTHTQESPSPSPDLPRGVFPINPEQMLKGVRLAEELTQGELDALAQSNAGVLPPDSPVRFLLEGRARPGSPLTAEHGYRHGVCIGAAALRRHLQHLSSEGVHFDAPPFDPDQEKPFPAPASSRLKHVLSLPIRRQLRRLEDANRAYGRAGAYFEGNEQIIIGGVLRGLLTGRIRLNGMPFLSDRQMETGDAPSFWLGVGDTLALHHRLYKRMGVAGNLSEASFVISQEALPIFRSHKQDVWPEAGLTSPQRFSQGPDFYRQTHLVGGYTAVMEKDGRMLRGDVWWNRHVPVGASVKKVRAFPSHGALIRAGEPGEYTDKVTSRFTVGSARLGKRDAVLVRGANGEIFTLGHPFTVTPDMALEDGTVELVRVCQFGDILDLMDEGVLDEAADAQCEALTTEILAGQEVPRWRRAARWLVDRHLPDDMVGSASVSTVGDLVSQAVSHVSPTAGSIGVSAATFAALRVGRAVSRHRRNRHAGRITPVQ